MSKIKGKEKINKVLIEEKVYLSGKGEFKSVIGTEIVRYQDANGKWHNWNETK